MSNKLLAVLIFFVFVLPAPAYAQQITDGHSLKDRCATFQLTTPSAGLACRAYIGAVADIMADGIVVSGKQACPPHALRREDLVKVTRDWLKARQDLLIRRAYQLIAQALSETFPCSSE